MTVNLFVSHSACCLNWGHLRQIYNPLCFRCFGNSVAHFPNGPQWTFPLFHQICVCQLDFWPFSLESCPRPCSLIPGQFCAWVWSLSHPTIEVGSSRARSCLCFLKVTRICQRLPVLFGHDLFCQTLKFKLFELYWWTKAMIYVDSGMSLCSIIFFFQSFWT